MALKKSASRKCPVCVGLTDEKVEDVNKALEPLLEDVRQSGEVPKAKDSRFLALAHVLGVAPFSLRFHLSKCLVKREIDDQMMLEFMEMLDALHTAKVEYKETPTLPFASALKQMHSAVLEHHKLLLGEQDPEQAVQFIAETVIGHVLRNSLGVFAKEARQLLTVVLPYLPPTHKTQVTKLVESALIATGNTLHEVAGEALDNVCSYYKVELDVASKKHALASVVVPPSFEVNKVDKGFVVS